MYRKRLRNVLLVGLIFFGCATSVPVVWVKSGADQNQFERERAVCVDQVQSKEKGIDQGAFGDCMQSKGWRLRSAATDPAVQSPASGELHKIFSDLALEKDERCGQVEYQPFFSKTACDPQGVTAAQMADDSFITGEQKKSFEKLRIEMRKSQDQALAAYREYGGSSGEQAAGLMETWYVFNDRNVDGLLEGKRSWGEYNRERKGLYNQLTRELQALSHPS